MCIIVQATNTVQYNQARIFFSQYADSLGFDLEFQGFRDELADIASMYSPPNGCLLFAQCSAEFAGCVGLRPFAEGICEMKRLYVRSEFRGRKIGRKLACSIIEKAWEMDYKKMRLDTIASMVEANGLYRSLGFYPIEPYRYNPVEHARYYELDLMRTSATSHKRKTACHRS